MGIFNKDFEKAIGSSQAAQIRGKMGVTKGNQFIKQQHNTYHRRNVGIVDED